jgi:heptosyltransferase I
MSVWALPVFARYHAGTDTGGRGDLQLMHILIVKTSSMGDVIHTLPAVTDAVKVIPGIRFDWVVEEGIAEIPAWHPSVDQVIPVALRRWRGQMRQAWRSGEWREFRQRLRSRRYDKIIDGQGLLKSAFITRMAQGRRCGLNRQSAREPIAALAYHERHAIRKGQHAITRVRQLFAACLDYKMPGGSPDYGLDRRRFITEEDIGHYLVFLHGTTWSTKRWPDSYWIELAHLVADLDYHVAIPWGDFYERERAELIARKCSNATVMPKLDLAGMANILAHSQGVVAVDTGLSHLAAALSVPCVTVYGATRPGLTGTLGLGQRHLRAQFPCSPCLSRECTYTRKSKVTPACYMSLPPEEVWLCLRGLIKKTKRAHAKV